MLASATGFGAPGALGDLGGGAGTGPVMASNPDLDDESAKAQEGESLDDGLIALFPFLDPDAMAAISTFQPFRIQVVCNVAS